MKLQSGAQRRLPRGGHTRTPMVDLWPADRRGDLLQGFIRVPNRLVNAPEHSKEAREFNALIESQLKRWAEWRAKSGWTLTGEIRVNGPWDPPTEGPGMPLDEADEEHKRYIVTARFNRDTPLWMPIDGMLHIRDLADMYGVDLFTSDVKEYGAPVQTKRFIDSPEPAHDPMQFAAERRRRLGLKREDFLFDENK